MTDRFEKIQGEIFRKMDREEHLCARLNEIIPAFEMHYACSDLSMLLSENFRELAECFEFEKRPYEAKEIQSRFELSRRRLFNYLSTLQSCIDVLFAVARRRPDEEKRKELDGRVLKFKKTPACAIANKLRNRVQHAGLLSEVLNFSYRTEHHIEGKGVDYKFSASGEIWDKVRKELGEEAATLLDSILGERNPFLKLNESFVYEFNDAVKDLKTISEAEQASEFVELRSIIEELDRIEAWCIENGMSSPISERLAPIKAVLARPSVKNAASGAIALIPDQIESIEKVKHIS